MLVSHYQLLFSSKYEVIGYDIDKKRISDLQNYFDKTKEVDSVDLKKLK